jgi:hypothetical protein
MVLFNDFSKNGALQLTADTSILTVLCSEAVTAINLGVRYYD